MVTLDRHSKMAKLIQNSISRKKVADVVSRLYTKTTSPKNYQKQDFKINNKVGVLFDPNI